MEGKRSRKTENIQQISSVSVIAYIFRLVGRITTNFTSMDSLVPAL